MACLRATLRLRLEFPPSRLRAWHPDPCLRKPLFDSCILGRPNVSIRGFAVKTFKPKSDPKARPDPSLQLSLPSRATQQPNPTSYVSSYVSFRQSLAKRSPSILLYQSPSFSWLYLVCYVVAGFCFTYSIVNLGK